jgi:hypothetical protein
MFERQEMLTDEEVVAVVRGTKWARSRREPDLRIEGVYADLLVVVLSTKRVSSGPPFGMRAAYQARVFLGKLMVGNSSSSGLYALAETNRMFYQQVDNLERAELDRANFATALAKQIVGLTQSRSSGKT